jgi:hypothetical protein
MALFESLMAKFKFVPKIRFLLPKKFINNKKKKWFLTFTD